jgi:hypothetical protein
MTYSLLTDQGRGDAHGGSQRHAYRTEIGPFRQYRPKYRAMMERGGMAALRNLSLGGRRSVLDRHARDKLADGASDARRSSPRLCYRC